MFKRGDSIKMKPGRHRNFTNGLKLKNRFWFVGAESTYNSTQAIVLRTLEGDYSLKAYYGKDFQTTRILLLEKREFIY